MILIFYYTWTTYPGIPCNELTSTLLVAFYRHSHKKSAPRLVSVLLMGLVVLGQSQPNFL